MYARASLVKAENRELVYPFNRRCWLGSSHRESIAHPLQIL